MSNKPRSEIRQVTPEWAAQMLLRHNDAIESGKFKQRTLNPKTVKLYATDMKAGNWGLNGEAISFDEDGNLLNGQHRLAAVVMADIPVMMLVMWDLPTNVNSRVRTIDTFDVGKKRSLSNQLHIEGLPYYSEIATASRLLVIVARGINSREALSTPQGVAVSSFLGQTMIKVIEQLRKNNAPKSKFLGRIVAPVTLLRTADPDTADLFAQEFNEMANLGKQSPVLHLQRFLDRPSHHTGGSDYNLRVFGAVATAMQAYANDKRVERINPTVEGMQWLLSTSKNTISKIREICGIEITPQEKP